MNLYSITNRTSAQNLGFYPGRTADEALDAYYSDAGYSCRIGAARALDTTVEALLADLVVVQYDYAADLETLAAAMVDDYRTSGECTTDVLNDPDAGSLYHWPARRVYGVAEELEFSLQAVDAIGWTAIRDAYAAAWRAAVEADIAAIRWKSDPDTDGGEVSSRAIPRAQARAMAVALVSEGWVVSEATDHDDDSLSWVYRVWRDDRGLAAAACPEVAPYLAAVELELSSRDEVAS